MRRKVLFILVALSSVCLAKDIKTVVLTTTPQIHCEGCEKKIKENIRFEKGVKSIKTNLQDKTITIEYDADKTTVPALIEGFKRIKYEAKEVKSDTKVPAPSR